jgi:MFS transporter, DHA3 family, macrolide efflux protein
VRGGKPGLWTKDFTIITLGTVISAIGGTAVSFAMSLIVFDNTGSTWLSGVFTAVIMLPNLVLPVISAPMVDKVCRRNLIAGLDGVMSLLYFGFSLTLFQTEFSYGMYVLFGLIVNSIGTVYYQAYSSLYPELIPEGHAQKGYSVSSLIYPTVTTMITPLAAAVYKTFSIAWFFAAEGALLLIASSVEWFITKDREERGKKPFSFRAYCSDVLGGIRYLKREKGVRSIYAYMAVVNSTAQGNSLMVQAYFQSTPALGVALYSLLISAETVGRMAGGMLHYFLKIPPERRYQLTEKVYILYESLDGAMLYVAYPLMIGIRFMLGFMGVNTATLRSAAVQKYLPGEIRARVEAVFSILISLGMIVFRLIAGALGEALPYRAVPLIMASVGLLCVYVLIIRNKRDILPIYNRDV